MKRDNLLWHVQTLNAFFTNIPQIAKTDIVFRKVYSIIYEANLKNLTLPFNKHAKNIFLLCKFKITASAQLWD